MRAAPEDPRQPPLTGPGTWQPRIGLGPDRVEPDRVRFRELSELFVYLCDYFGLNQAELARRCGVRRERVSRWIHGRRDPGLAELRTALEPLGWAPVIGIERVTAVLDELLARPFDLHELLDWPVFGLLSTVAAAAGELDLVIGGEVAAVLQGVPLRTRHLVIHVREEQQGRLFEIARARWQDAWPCLDDGTPAGIRCGQVTASVRCGPVRPAGRIVRHEDESIAGTALPVVELTALLAADPDDPAGLGPTAREVVKRFLERGGGRP